MKLKFDLASASVDQLIARFTDIALRQEEALIDLKTATYNKLYGEMEQVVEELRHRGRAELGTLSSLYSHRSGQVRVKAAVHSLGVHPTKARRVLADLARANDYPSTVTAREMLEAYDSGRFVPK